MSTEDASKEIGQLLDRLRQPIQGNQFRLPPMSHRIIGICFDMQRLHGLSTEKTLAGLAIALAEALDNQEKIVLDGTYLQPPAPILLCADCPKRKDLTL